MKENLGKNVCPYWMAYTFDNPLRRFFHNPVKMFSPYIRKGMKVMDLGCGMGFFSLGMALLTGPEGKVYSVDLQSKMLEKVQKRAQKRGLSERIILHQCQPDRIDLKMEFDFVLCFWMLHETPDIEGCLKEIYSILKPGGVLFLAEPGMHVNKDEFLKTLNKAREIGFLYVEDPEVKLSYSAVLKK